MEEDVALLSPVRDECLLQEIIQHRTSHFSAVIMGTHLLNLLPEQVPDLAGGTRTGAGLQRSRGGSSGNCARSAYAVGDA